MTNNKRPLTQNGLQQLVESLRLSEGEIKARARQIYEQVLAESRHLDGGNFRAIHPDDLQRLFDHYDRLFFDGQCRRALGPGRLTFRLSRRMTRSGGKTARFVQRSNPANPRYEITISTTLLYHTFHDGQRPIQVTGIVCRDRLEALQRIFEHELIHLIEMLVWIESSCGAIRFQSLADHIFGHREHTHQLITPGEWAWTRFGVRPGEMVRFRFDGIEHVGIVNRITRRATVLVEDPLGERYSDGKHYVKFYVPLQMLQPYEKQEGIR